MAKFFYNHVLPSNSIEANRFLESLRLRGQEGLDTLRDEISGFTDTELSQFLEHVLIQTFDENVMAMVYQTAPTIDKMSFGLVTDHFQHLYKSANSGLISQEFFEECAACLIKYYHSSRGLNLLADLSKIIEPNDKKSYQANDLITDKIDLAMVGHLKKSLPIMFSNNIFLRASDTLRRVDLPESLRVMVRHRLDDNDHDSAIKLTGELFHSNRLSDRYIEVLRQEMGDELFLQGCIPYALGSNGLHSIAKLAPIFGEETFHTKDFLDKVYWSKKDVRTPHHIQKFHEIGFDEQRLPLLAAHVEKNLALAMRFKSQVIKGLSIIPNTASLASRLGKGREALKAFLEGQKELSVGEREGSYADIIAGLDIGVNHPEYTMAHSISKTVLLDVVDAVGIEVLHEIVPDASGEFVSQYLAAKGPEISRKEVFRLFPQAKARVLENDLGM